jgi:hypothetical protein
MKHTHKYITYNTNIRFLAVHKPRDELTIFMLTIVKCHGYTQLTMLLKSFDFHKYHLTSVRTSQATSVALELPRSPSTPKKT